MPESHDQFCKRLLTTKEPHELRAWVRSGPNTLGENASHLSAVRMTEKIYRLGAVNAYAIETWDGNTGKLVIELPRISAKRKDLFKWAAKIADGLGFDPTPDKGQQFLFVMLD